MYLVYVSNRKLASSTDLRTIACRQQRCIIFSILFLAEMRCKCEEKLVTSSVFAVDDRRTGSKGYTRTHRTCKHLIDANRNACKRI